MKHPYVNGDLGCKNCGLGPDAEAHQGVTMLLRQALAEERPQTPQAPIERALQAYHRPMTLGECVAAEGGIGDVTSDVKGSGARFNQGKPDLSLVPLVLLARDLRRSHPDSIHIDALEHLGFFQETHDTKWLFAVLEDLGVDGWEECAHVFDYGRRKYAAWNWAKGMPWSVPVACAARHLLVMAAGMHLDNESQLPHRGHVFCNVAMLLQYAKTYTAGNDLPPKGLL